MAFRRPTVRSRSSPQDPTACWQSLQIWSRLGPAQPMGAAAPAWRGTTKILAKRTRAPPARRTRSTRRAGRTMPNTTASPRPLPCPGALVVKNGSKMRGRTLGGDARPRVLHREADEGTRAAADVDANLRGADPALADGERQPPAERHGIPALTQRLSSTRPSSDGSTNTSAGADGVWISTSIGAPTGAQEHPVVLEDRAKVDLLQTRSPFASEAKELLDQLWRPGERPLRCPASESGRLVRPVTRFGNESEGEKNGANGTKRSAWSYAKVPCLSRQTQPELGVRRTRTPRRSSQSTPSGLVTHIIRSSQAGQRSTAPTSRS